MTLCTQAAYAGVRVLVSYRIVELGGGPLLVGLAASAFALAPLLLTVPVGRMVDKRLGPAVMRTGAVLTVAAPAIIALRQDLRFLLAGFVLLGFAQMLATLAGQGIISAKSPAEKLDQRFGGWGLAVSTGQLIGVPLAGILAASGSKSASVHTTTALLAMTGVAAVAVPFAVLTRRSRPMDVVLGGYRKRKVGSLLGEKGMRPAIFSSLMVLVSLDILAAYLPLLGQRHGLSVLTVTVLLSIRTTAALLSRALLPLMLRHFNRNLLLVSSTLASAVPMALIAFVPSPVVIGLFLAAAGLFWGIGQPLTMSWVVQLAGQSHHASGLSLRLSANRLGQVVIPAAAGLATGTVGVGAVFLVTGLLLGSAGVATWRSLTGDT
ncbi:MFS transporter [Arthrobacter sp. STN4]|uniref:MFS transporter n=1 Tax=Arthrobacter sp. STN4 TaxID=2923276 RepID=UPI00211A6B72|nr:MFS transporter [Arthrobacter sp. STN4]MCQ9163747.1 MFS transporter [Arthrobacter sp. STN4]